MSSKSTEIRGSRKAEILGTLAGWLMRLWNTTLRFEVQDRCGITDPDNKQPPVIYAMWHNRILVIPSVWRKNCGCHRKAVVLTSASKDGAILSRAMAVFGIGSVRGSSSRRAVAAWRRRGPPSPTATRHRCGRHRAALPEARQLPVDAGALQTAKYSPVAPPVATDTRWYTSFHIQFYSR